MRKLKLYCDEFGQKVRVVDLGTGNVVIDGSNVRSIKYVASVGEAPSLTVEAIVQEAEVEVMEQFVEKVTIDPSEEEKDKKGG